jgi:hypothetical protein
MAPPRRGSSIVDTYLDYINRNIGKFELKKRGYLRTVVLHFS